MRQTGIECVFSAARNRLGVAARGTRRHVRVQRSSVFQFGGDVDLGGIYAVPKIGVRRRIVPELQRPYLLFSGRWRRRRG